MVVFGGVRSMEVPGHQNIEVELNDLHLFNTTTNKWTSPDVIRLIPARKNHNACKLYSDTVSCGSLYYARGIWCKQQHC